MKRSFVAALALTAAMIWGCVTEEIPPPAIHTSAYVTNQSDDTAQDTGAISNTLPSAAATSELSAPPSQAVTAGSASVPLPPLSTFPPPPPPGR